MIVVDIGMPPTSFTVAKSFLFHYLPDHDIGDRAGKNLNVAFPDTGPEIFGLFVEWMNTQNIVLVNALSSFTIKPSLHDLCELWVFAHNNKLPKLQNYTIGIINNLNQFSMVYRIDTEFPLIELVYSKIKSDNHMLDCPLARYLIDRLVWKCGHDVYHSQAWKFTRKMLADIAFKLTQRCFLHAVNNLTNINNYHVTEKISAEESLH